MVKKDQQTQLKASNLDFHSILKAAQAISGEVHLATLLRKFMHFVIEHSGAERGMLLRQAGEEWLIEGEGHNGDPEVPILQPLNIENNETAPAAIIQYVAHTHKTIVLHDASDEGYFTQNPYIRKNQSKSIVCLPLLNQSRSSSILYLENDLITGAFTPDRVDVLLWLCIQFASLIDNAWLYQDMERRVEERSRERKAEIAERKQTGQALRETLAAVEEAKRAAEAAVRDEEVRRHEAVQRWQIAGSLKDIISLLNSNRSLEEVLNYMASKASALLGNQATIIYRSQQKTRGVLIQAAHGFPINTLPEREIPLELEPLRDVILTPWPVSIADIFAVLSSEGEPDLELLDRVLASSQARPYGALLALPIILQDEIFGRICLYYTEPRLFSEEEIDLAVAFCDQVALAIENAHLREKIKHAAVIGERHRLAHDLHDAVTQTIFSASLISEAMPGVWELDPDEGRRGLEELRQMLRGAVAEMRTLLLELRPAAIIEKNLGELLHHLTEAMTSQIGVPITLTVEEDRPLPSNVQIVFYRIAQEALNNIAKYAQASKIAVNLHCLLGRVALHIKDNGCGFNPSAILPDHLGISIMRERAATVDATFKITSRSGHGTQVAVIWMDCGERPFHD